MVARDRAPLIVGGSFLLLIGALIWLASRALDQFSAPSRQFTPPPSPPSPESMARWGIIETALLVAGLVVLTAAVSVVVVWAAIWIYRQISQRNLIPADRRGLLPVKAEDLSTAAPQTLAAYHQTQTAKALAMIITQARETGRLGAAGGTDVLAAAQTAATFALPPGLATGPAPGPATTAAGTPRLAPGQLATHPRLTLSLAVEHTPAPGPGAILVGLQLQPAQPVWVGIVEFGHWAVAGRTRTGKTTFSQGLIALARRATGAEVYVIDPHYRADPGRWAAFEHCFWRPPAAVGSDQAAREREIDAALEAIDAELSRRIDLGGRSERPLLIYLDEFATMMKTHKRRQQVVERILREAGKFGIWLVCCSTDFLIGTTGGDTGLRGNFGRGVFFGGEGTAADSVLGAQPDQTPLVKGFGYYRHESAAPILLRIADVTDADLYALLGTPVSVGAQTIEGTWSHQPATTPPPPSSARPHSGVTRQPTAPLPTITRPAAPPALARSSDEHPVTTATVSPRTPGTPVDPNATAPTMPGWLRQQRWSGGVRVGSGASDGGQAAPVSESMRDNIVTDAGGSAGETMGETGHAGAGEVAVGLAARVAAARARVAIASVVAERAEAGAPGGARTRLAARSFDPDNQPPLTEQERAAAHAALLRRLAPEPAIGAIWGASGGRGWMLSKEGRYYSRRVSLLIAELLAPIEAADLPEVEGEVVRRLQRAEQFTVIAREVYGVAGGGGRAYPAARDDMLDLVARLLTAIADAEQAERQAAD